MEISLKAYLKGMEESIQELKKLKETNPEEAEKKARESLIQSGILKKDGSAKKHICNYFYQA
ncbi:MAG: hypothetical protein ACRC5H_02675 [Treponemataceae bacterium]